MIEKVLQDYLKSCLNVPVYLQHQGTADKFVIIEKTGSRRNDLITTSTVAFQSYAPNMYEAALLNEAVKAAMDESVCLREVSLAKLNSDYNFTDTQTKEYRYQAVYDITHI